MADPFTPTAGFNPTAIANTGLFQSGGNIYLPQAQYDASGNLTKQAPGYLRPGATYTSYDSDGNPIGGPTDLSYTNFNTQFTGSIPLANLGLTQAPTLGDLYTHTPRPYGGDDPGTDTYNNDYWTGKLNTVYDAQGNPYFQLGTGNPFSATRMGFPDPGSPSGLGQMAGMVAGAFGGPLAAMAANTGVTALTGGQGNLQGGPVQTFSDPTAAAAAGAGGNVADPSTTTPNLGDLAGGLFSTGLGIAGGMQGVNALEEAQKSATNAGQFNPWSVYTGTGSATFGPGGATSTLDPAYQGLRTQLLGNASGGFGALGTYDPNAMATQTYNQMQAMAAPDEAAQRANLTAQLQQQGQTGLAIGGDPTNANPAMQAAYNPQMAALMRAQSQAAQGRQLSAIDQSQQIANQMQARATGQLGAGLQLDQSMLPYMQFGAGLGQTQTSAALAAEKMAQDPRILQGLAKGGMLSGMAGGAGSFLSRLLGGSGGAGNLTSLLGNAGGYLRNLFGGGGGSGGIPSDYQSIMNNYGEGDPYGLGLDPNAGVGYGTTPMLPNYPTPGSDVGGGVADYGSPNYNFGLDLGGGGGGGIGDFSYLGDSGGGLGGGGMDFSSMFSDMGSDGSWMSEMFD